LCEREPEHGKAMKAMNKIGTSVFERDNEMDRKVGEKALKSRLRLRPVLFGFLDG
jgi:hypothetical protein